MPYTLRVCAVFLATICAIAADNDARDQLARRLTSLAMPHLTERARAILAIQSRAAAEKRQQQVRARLLAMIGGLPIAAAPLNAKTTGTLERDGVRIEKIVFESLPNFYVTANLYLPAAASGPYPAVLMTPGHAVTGKAGEYPLAVNFARNGIAAFAYDPMSEGERLQYFDPATGKSAVGGPTGEHAQASIAANLTGEHISRYFVLDAMRAIDYLISRKEIDAARIGAFGCSGGGTVTAYLAAFDPRVKAAASACYITAFQDLLASPTGAQEAEQTIPGFISEGFDLADWVELAAPRPYAIVSTTEDMFPFAGAKRTYEEARRFYGFFGAEDQLSWITGPGPHGNLTPVHPQILAFFKRALTGDAAPPTYTRLAAPNAADLECTATGQVASALHSVSIAQIIAKSRPAELAPDFRGPAGIEAHPGKPAPVNTGMVGDSLSSEDGVLLPGRRVATHATGRRPLILILGDDMPAGLAGSYRVVWQASLRPSPPGTESAKSTLQGAFYLLSLRAELIGRSLVGMRADDIIRWIDALTARPDVNSRAITVYAKGAYGVALLHAAALDKRITHAVVEDAPKSYGEILDHPLHRNAPEISIPRVLQHYDLPDLVKAIGPKRLTLLDSYHPEPLLPHLTK